MPASLPWNLGIRPLPNLETRFVAADTLIPIEKSGEQQLDLLDAQIKPLRRELEQVRHEHFSARSPSAKRACRERDAALRAQIADLLRDSGLPAESARKLAAWDPYDQNAYAPFFDPEWMFGLNGGADIPVCERQAGLPAPPSGPFDIVIGNPPYVLLQTVGLTGSQLAEWRERYVSAQYKVDLYQVFFEASLKLLRSAGVLAFITPNTFLKNKFSATLRKLLLSQSQPLAFLLFYYPVFPGQSVDNVVSIWRKHATPDLGALSAVRSASINSNQDLLAPLRWRLTPSTRILPPSYDLELDVNESAAEILTAIDASSQPLGAFCSAYFGIQTRDRTRFVSSDPNKKHFLPVIDGTNVKRWSYVPPSEYVDFRPLAIKSGGDSEIYAKPRIVVRQIGVFPEGCLCPPGLLTLNTIYNIYETATQGRLSYFLGVINSLVAAYYWRLRFFDNKETFPKIKKAPLLSIPIAAATDDQRRTVESVVKSLTFLAAYIAGHPAAQTPQDTAMLAYWERVLNGLVYELYFPEEVHGAGLRLFDLVAAAGIPDLSAVAEKARLPTLRQAFETLQDPDHPLRQSLDQLQTLETVKIIEGKA